MIDDYHFSIEVNGSRPLVATWGITPFCISTLASLLSPRCFVHFYIQSMNNIYLLTLNFPVEHINVLVSFNSIKSFYKKKKNHLQVE